jgi:hypothetical protein
MTSNEGFRQDRMVQDGMSIMAPMSLGGRAERRDVVKLWDSRALVPPEKFPPNQQERQLSLNSEASSDTVFHPVHLVYPV